MARTDRNSALAEPMTPEETSLMDADRDNEHAQPDLPLETPEPEPEPGPEAPAAAPEPAEHAEPEIDPDTGKQRKVDYGALHAEREKRKTIEAKERETSQKLATLMGRFDVLSQLAQKQTAPQTQAQTPQQIEVPDINLDPVGHFQAKDAIREQELTQLRQWKDAQEKQSETYSNVQRLQQIAQSHEVEFSKNTPDYQEAFTYLRQNRDDELEAMGYADPAVRQQIINNDALQIAAQALQGNRNAAEAVYKIAKARGWAGKAPAAPVPAQAPEVHPDTVKLKTVAKGQAASASIGQVNGSAPAETGVQAILAMSDTDFAAKFGGEAGEANWRKLMGG
jgi:hypothetical protein